ncbi:hypothetical protein KPSA1_07143 [Pseudomonas syringae pv. actinidiae]|uniref:Uncharacterized protein n=1 Tax=Pseudomonas syringae pv. actinidiae TaxID=103796 RepID=A0A2V0QL28_PSESF|nr:hypothetical protein KPSA1_07143 [Pseudomonas syringae pv. actinidiae]
MIAGCRQDIDGVGGSFSNGCSGQSIQDVSSKRLTSDTDALSDQIGNDDTKCYSVWPERD